MYTSHPNAWFNRPCPCKMSWARDIESSYQSGKFVMASGGRAGQNRLLTWRCTRVISRNNTTSLIHAVTMLWVLVSPRTLLPNGEAEPRGGRNSQTASIDLPARVIRRGNASLYLGTANNFAYASMGRTTRLLTKRLYPTTGYARVESVAGIFS